MKEVTTGWFGQPNRGRSTQVHVKTKSGVCLCGYKPHKSFEYQWCSHGITLEYVECSKCRKKAEKILQKHDKEKHNEYHNRKTSKN